MPLASSFMKMKKLIQGNASESYNEPERSQQHDPHVPSFQTDDILSEMVESVAQLEALLPVIKPILSTNINQLEKDGINSKLEPFLNDVQSLLNTVQQLLQVKQSNTKITGKRSK